MIDLIPDSGIENTIAIILLSAGSIWAVHEGAHTLYGADAAAVGSVGGWVFLAAGVGTWIALATAGMFFGE